MKKRAADYLAREYSIYLAMLLRLSTDYPTSLQKTFDGPSLFTSSWLYNVAIMRPDRGEDRHSLSAVRWKRNNGKAHLAYLSLAPMDMNPRGTGSVSCKRHSAV